LARLISLLSRQAAAEADVAESSVKAPSADELEAGTHALDQIRGYEGQGAHLYFEVFALHLRQQREDFAFTTRSRRPPRDAINCLLSYLYALIRHDCIAALTATGLDPFVGYLHTERPNRPALALDLMEEFRPLLADRLAITLINRRQITKNDFIMREGGAVEFTAAGRKAVIAAYQTRKQDVVHHPLLDQECRLGHLMLTQARILARHLRGDIPKYLPYLLK
jgi:CRISPR-associated protein Cas1